MKTDTRENIGYILSILFTIIFLTGTTYLWTNLHQSYDEANSLLKTDTQVVTMENIDICSDIESERLLGYNFTITSNYDINKNYDVKIISDNIKSEDIHYTIDNSEIMSLDNGNRIISDNIDAYGEHNYKLKVWLTDNYVDNSINVVIDFK